MLKFILQIFNACFKTFIICIAWNENEKFKEKFEQFHFVKMCIKSKVTFTNFCIFFLLENVNKYIQQINERHECVQAPQADARKIRQNSFYAAPGF